MAFKILLKVIAGDHSCFIGALRQYNPDVFSAARAALQRKDGTRAGPPVRLVEINDALLHDLRNLLFADVAAIHAAKRMFGIIDHCRMAVESLVLLRFVPPPYNEGEKEKKKHNNGKNSSSFFHAAN